MEEGAHAQRLASLEVDRTRRRLAHVAQQSPLLETRPSLAAMRGVAAGHPSAIFAGVGLVSSDRVSEALPLDVLGLVLGAEAVRRSVGATHLIMLVADAHALHQGAEPEAVERCADHYATTLRRVARQCDLGGMRVMRASELSHSDAFGRILHDVESRAPQGTDAYITREVADIAFLRQQYPGLVKVGWALKPSTLGATRDERMFDTCYRTWLRDSAWFLYTKAGRVFNDRRQKAPPYVTREVDRRICLHAGEDATAKLAYNRTRVSESTWRGVCNHLRAITRSYSRLVRPLAGPLPVRTQAMIEQIAGARGAAPAE